MPCAKRELIKKWIRNCSAAVALLAPLALSPQPVPEDELKVAFVYNFILFAEWPGDTSFERNVLSICINPHSALRQSLARLNDKSVNGRRIAVRPLAAPEGVRACHVLFIDSSDREHWKQIRKELATAAVLTIADDEEIGHDGSVIALKTLHNRIIFEVDMTAANRARVALSSKLLRLARSVQ